MLHNELFNIQSATDLALLSNVLNVQSSLTSLCSSLHLMKFLFLGKQTLTIITWLVVGSDRVKEQYSRHLKN